MPKKLKRGANGLIPLTDREVLTLDWLVEYTLSHNFPPTMVQWAKGLGRSRNTVYAACRNLMKKGWVGTIGNGKKKTYVPLFDSQGRPFKLHHQVVTEGAEATPPTPTEPDHWEVPLMGRIAAGRPIDSQPDNVELQLKVPATMLGRMPSSARLFALRVKGDSMLGDGIHDGDVAVIQRVEGIGRANPPQPKRIYAIGLGDEATLKRARIDQQGTLLLVPSNPDHEVQTYYKASAVEPTFYGQMVGLLKRWPPGE